jgi:hypothetical protein
VEPAGLSEFRNLVQICSTSAGNPASDGRAGGNGPFMALFHELIQRPGLGLINLVTELTGQLEKVQLVNWRSSLTKDFFFVSMPPELQTAVKVDLLQECSSAPAAASPQELPSAPAAASPQELPSALKVLLTQELASPAGVPNLSQGGASDDEVKKAYRQMDIKFHPDKVAQMGEEYQKGAKEKFQKIQESYDAIKKQRGFK